MFARVLTAKGFVCMGFDYHGFKPSEGTTKYTTLEREVEDVCYPNIDESGNFL